MATTRAMELERAQLPPPAKGYPSVYDPSPYLNGPRHEYLNVCVPDVNPRILSRTVDRAMKRSDPCLRHCEPPLLALQEASPNIYAPEIDSTKTTEVFGRRVLPNLRKDLDLNDTNEVRRAIMAISEIVHDPQKVCEAVRVSLVEKLVELMKHEDPTIRERSCAVMETLANREIARDALLRLPNGLATLKATLNDPVSAVRFRAALAFRTLVRFRLGPYELDEAEMAPFLVHMLRWETDPKILGVAVTTLSHMLEMDSTREFCISQGAFPVLTGLMKKRCNVEATGGALGCMARLAMCNLGKTLADERGILGMSEMREFLASKNSYVSGRAAFMVMNMTHTTKGRRIAYETKLLDPLVELARHRTNRRAQLFSLQALTNMAEYAPCRAYLRTRDDTLAKLEVADADAESVRKRVLDAVRWCP